MNIQDAADVLNAHAHRDHADWKVMTRDGETVIEIDYQVEDCTYRLTPFEAEAIAMRYMAMGESPHRHVPHGDGDSPPHARESL